MSTEKRLLLATALSFLVLMVFYPWMTKKQTSQTPPPAAETVENKASEPVPAVVKEATAQKDIPVIEPAEFYELTNDIYSIKFSNVGAGISELLIKQWGKKKIGRTELIQPADPVPAFAVSVLNDPNMSGLAHYRMEHIDHQAKIISFVHDSSNDLRIRKKYQLFEDKSAFYLTIQVDNLSSQTRQVPLQIRNQIFFGKLHDAMDRDQIESFVIPKAGKVQVKKEGKIVKNPFLVEDRIDWQALTIKYFSVIVKPETLVAERAKTTVSANGESLVSTLDFPAETLAPGAQFETKFLIYAGPEYREDLKSFGYGFEQTLTQGVFGAFRYYLFVLLMYCHQLTGNFGFAIIVLTILVKVLFSPFTHMSFESMRKMQAVQPKIKALQEQFKKDPQRMNKEMMELYRRHKVNPMGGCLPMVLQIPIFIGFYQVLGQMVELKGESIWWVKDLTLPDQLAKISGFEFNLLPILMVGSMWWQQKMTPQPATSTDQAKIMQWMPVIMGFFFYGLPSGLVLYWTLSNLLTVAHQILIHHRAKPIAID